MARKYMMQAITTKYHGPTNSRGSRITATTESGIKHSQSYKHELNADENHADAAEALARRLGWLERNDLVGGSIKGGYAFVLVDK